MSLHATAVVREGRAVLLIGPSGSGKSDLALRLIDRGWRLLADDQVMLACDGDRLTASAPGPTRGLIEARGVGIVEMPAAHAAPVALVVDLVRAPDRLPEPEWITLEGVAVPLIALAAFEASAPIKLELGFARALRTG